MWMLTLMRLQTPQLRTNQVSHGNHPTAASTEVERATKWCHFTLHILEATNVLLYFLYACIHDSTEYFE